jgi:uroporphyrinogen III methyltransferase/synthase
MDPQAIAADPAVGRRSFDRDMTMTGTGALPLSNWRVLVTRPAEQADSLLEALRQAGATPVAYPTIGLEAPPSWAPFDAAIGRVASFDWIVFCSPSAVRFALGRAPQLEALLRLSPAPAVAAVGDETARRLNQYGIPVALVPQDQRQEGLVAAFGDRLPAGTRVLFPQTIGGREHLREALCGAGAIVEVVPVSRTVGLPLDVPPPPFDAVIFASPSAVKAFVAKLTVAALRDKVVAVMGATTRDAAVAAGVGVHVVPAAPSVVALVDALGAYRAGS